MVTVGRVSLLSALRRTPPPALENGGASIRARLDYEVGRARRYGGSVSLVAVREASTSSSNGHWHRFAADLASSLRDLDTCQLESHVIALVLPETDVAGRSHVVARILQRADRDGLAVEVLASTFPDDAPTSDALLRSVTGVLEA